MKQEVFKKLIQAAEAALLNDDIPVAAAVLDIDGDIVAIGYNTRNKNMDISAHAEIIAINNAIKQIGNLNLSDYKIISTLEPCEMCYGAIKQAKIKDIDFFLDSSKFGVNSVYSINDIDITLNKVGTKEQTNVYKKLLEEFFKKKR